MAVTYWTGKNLTLRAIQPEDIVIFDLLDDEILRNIDSLHFPRSTDKMREWVEEQLEEDECRFIAVDRDNNIARGVPPMAGPQKVLMLLALRRQKNAT